MAVTWASAVDTVTAKTRIPAAKRLIPGVYLFMRTPFSTELFSAMKCAPSRRRCPWQSDAPAAGGRGNAATEGARRPWRRGQEESPLLIRTGWDRGPPRPGLLLPRIVARHAGFHESRGGLRPQ